MPDDEPDPAQPQREPEPLTQHDPLAEPRARDDDRQYRLQPDQKGGDTGRHAAGHRDFENTAQCSAAAGQPGHQATLTAARFAAKACDVPVRLVGPDIAGFGVGCCAWAAAEAISCGQSLDEAALRAELLVAEIGQVTVTDGGSVSELADLLAGREREVHVAIGLADRVSRPLLEALEAALAGSPQRPRRDPVPHRPRRRAVDRSRLGCRLRLPPLKAVPVGRSPHIPRLSAVTISSSSIER